jgi:phosphohistidine phosphatase
MKELLLCRHAKSSWKNTQLEDIARPLNKRGKKNAPCMGQRLADQDMVPDLILTSPAKRARKTAALLCRGMQVDDSLIQPVPSLYDTDVQGLLRVVQKSGNSSERLMLVGHNCELTEFVNEFAHTHIYNVPTCGIVGYAFAVDGWQELTLQMRARFLFFEYPKKQCVEQL